jgi:hypothetical protein
VMFEINHVPREELVKELLSSCFGHDEGIKQYFMQGLHSPNNLCSIAAKKGELLVGLAVAWRKSFHPYCTYISITAYPLFRDGLKILLLTHLEAYEETIFPLQTSIWETSYDLKSFYEKNGFKEIRRTYTTTLPVSIVPERRTIIHHLQLMEQPTVKNFTELYSNEEIKTNLVKLVKDSYEKTHIANPLGVHDLKTWEQLVLGKETILEGSYVVINGNEVVAFSMLHDSDTPEKLEFGWRGTKEDIDSNLIVLLTSYQIEYAKHQGFELIEGEIDTTDPFSLEMLKHFPFSPSPAFITYQKGQINK